MKKGKVYIIGAGPGDYRLLTLKAAECIGKSGAVVYDRLIDSRILNLASGAELVNVGKFPGHHPVPQEEINKILLKLAEEGKNVARVKGGDPFLFGRGGEECEFLQKHGIEFEVVPGVTSAIAVPAYAGIPVTHRDYAASLHVFTGHSAENNGQVLDFDTISGLEGTLVFLMGVKNIKEICSGLIKHGKPVGTPAAVIEKGAGPEQTVLSGTLGDIGEKVMQAGVGSPAVIVIGRVAELGEKLAWFKRGLLSGRSIVVTRPSGQSGNLVKSLEELGAQVIEFPVIKVVEAEVLPPLERALNNIGEYGWLVFTSSNGVNIFFRQLKRLGRDIRLLSGLKLAAIGPATAEALMEKGFNVDFMPEKYSSEDLLDGLLKRIGQNEKVLLARSEIAGDELPEGLKKNNIEFDEIIVYRTIANNDIEKSGLIELLKDNRVDYITLTSPSTAEAFVSIVGRDAIKNAHTARFVCIGPVTAKAAENLDLTVSGYAGEYDDDGIVKKLTELEEVDHGSDKKAQTAKNE